MGVTKLWQLLAEGGEGEERQLSDCSGQAWAIDLSGWIMHARTASMANPTLGADFTMVRTLFHRALCLLKHGIRPICVMDGKMAPEIKSQTLKDRSQKPVWNQKEMANDRSGLVAINNTCREMLEALGLQVITSSGEAEKTCAILNAQGIVDACLTEDSDIFLYRAVKVYRNLNVKKETAEEYTMAGVEDKLKVNRRDLVLMGLLSGCDYGGGVKGIGPKKVCSLIGAMKNYCSDVLDRVCHWRDSPELISLEQRRFKATKSRHCSVCQHPGSESQHGKAGCSICGSQLECKAVSEGIAACVCEYHSLQKYKLELDTRQKALQQHDFPRTQLLDEFLGDRETFSFSRVETAMPKWGVLASTLRFTTIDSIAKMIPILIHMHLHGTLVLHEAEPISVLKECTRNFVPCYLVRWNRFEFDKWTPVSTCVEKTPPSKDKGPSDPHDVAVSCELFAKKYPKLVDEYKRSQASTQKKNKGKRPKDSSQTQLTSFKAAKVKRVLPFNDDPQTSSGSQSL